MQKVSNIFLSYINIHFSPILRKVEVCSCAYVQDFSVDNQILVLVLQLFHSFQRDGKQE